MTLGFMGIGRMGLPMARALLASGSPLIVWNRTPGKCVPLVESGACQAASVDALCAAAQVVFLMLLNEQAIDEALGRGSEAFRGRVAGTTFVQLGTTAAEYSRALAHDITECGGRYVEAPVSGSRVPAEQGRLIGMVAGQQDLVGSVRPLLNLLCREIFSCGPIPHAMRMKLAVNHYLIASVTALVETVKAADQAGIDLPLLRDILNAGPMVSEVSRGKLEKLVASDFESQAAIGDVATIADLVLDQAALARAHAPLIAECAALFHAAAARGHQALDMVAVMEPSAGGTEAAVPGRGFPTAASADMAPVRARPSGYPEPFASRIGAGREKRPLGDVFGLRHVGINLTRLAPGAVSALKHAHSRQDEFVYVLEGTPVLHSGEEQVVMVPGMCAGFRHGTGLGHQLANASAHDVVYLEIGDRSAGDVAIYPDDDLMAIGSTAGWRYFHRDGKPY